jgi:hypothetical protein
MGSRCNRSGSSSGLTTTSAVLYNQLGILARNCSLDIGECVEYAYNEIKNREGRVVDGVLIKNE